MPGDWLGVALVIVLLLINGFFVAAEFSLVSVRKTRIAERVARGDTNARAVQRAISDPDRFIAATQLGITLASLGLGWIGDWYKLSGSASDYVVDQIPQFASDAAKKFAADYEAKYGSKPSPSAAGLSYDFSNFFIKIMEEALADSCEITSESLYKIAQDKLWTGTLAYTDGIIMSNYDFGPDSIPDPVVGKGHYIFPALQYNGGEATVVWPADVAAGTLQEKP